MRMMGQRHGRAFVIMAIRISVIFRVGRLGVRVDVILVRLYGLFGPGKARRFPLRRAQTTGGSDWF